MSTQRKLEALTWRRSSYTTGGSNGGTTCVEVAFGEGFAAVRDSKDPAGGVLTTSRSAWKSFLDAVCADHRRH
ncbi:DUF397 domain-containing protein [Actinopolyspora mortivallis]|uniref:DUF397 domain-containing protein n=1 Tax=Actinopolyspora mortivallis TaxID=33906 RepID=A0A2T0GZH0_ACTMO|nr:DUF397 domain-containing protein [Actinopolyspora mortivallis]PRW64516.1 DUF397 domain-containing protein [Actinopolyspora mortivallis]